MKWINAIIGILIIFFGSTLMSLKIYNEELKTVSYNIIGILFFTVGVIYLKKVAKFGKQ